MTENGILIHNSAEQDVLLNDYFYSEDHVYPEDDLEETLPVEESVFSHLDDYGTLIDAPLASPAVYEYGPVVSRPISFNTPLPRIESSATFTRPRFRFAVSGSKVQSRFLFSISENGVKEDVVLEHLESEALSVPYLLGAYYGLLGMALIGAAVRASELRDVFERASPQLSFPPDGEFPLALGDHQDLLLPATTRWMASLCAPVRFNAAAPVTVDEFLPQTEDVIRWRALRDLYRCREHQRTLPAGVGVAGHVNGRLLVKPVSEQEFFASRRHPVIVTLPSGTVIMMYLNTLDGFGCDRHNPAKSPLLNWAVSRLHCSGGINTVYRHGLQRTVFSLLAEECYNAHLDRRRTKVPWVGGNGKFPLMPVVLDYEVVHPEANGDDLFRHVLNQPM